MLWHIELKFCIWLCFPLLKFKFECRQFPSIFVGVIPLLDLRILKIHSFPALFSYMLWHIELKFCIWLCFPVLQIKIECRQFPSIFVGVMPLLDLRILKIHNFPHFSRTPFDILSWKLQLDFCFPVLQIKFECRQFPSILVGVMPLLELRILEIHNVPHFSLTRFDILSLEFCIWLCFPVLQIKFECHQFPSIFVEVMPLLDLRILEIHSFPHFSLTCFDILSWNFAYDFV